MAQGTAQFKKSGTMPRSFFLFIIIATLSCPALARPLVTDTPLCGTLVNKSNYKVYGSVSTEYFPGPNGQQRHWQNFTLKPEERMQICSQGPFYKDYTLELVLRTLIPVFNCYTRLGGEIIIDSRQREDGSTETFATCL